MKPRALILPIAAVIIAALLVYRLQREERRPVASGPVGERRLAPNIVLSSQSRQLVKLEGYLGRTRIVLLFFDADRGADGDPILVQLGEHHPELEEAGIQVIAVSTATRYENAQSEQRLGWEFPFPLLTDIDPDQPIPAPAHQAWGLFDAEHNQTRTGLFLIERDGTVRWDDGRPHPVSDPQSVIDQLIAGSWPSGE
jgi:peroxiredoxin